MQKDNKQEYDPSKEQTSCLENLYSLSKSAKEMLLGSLRVKWPLTHIKYIL